ncbi:MAG: leucine-rich repeat protein, partial [Eggerthellaceae bacterium]|nr:leucine-rich repeat protein [Eggerthellaceae bacterium]
EFARKRAAAALRRAAELARLSEERIFADGRGTVWTYLVVDGSFARLCGCETECASLEVPGELDGYPVREIDAEALSGLDAPREIICSACIEAIGSYAFRSCANLRRLVLPAATSRFSSSWIARCPNIVELVLPGALEVIEADVLACPTVQAIEIGTGTRAVKPGAFEKGRIRELLIDRRNAYLSTDGTCIYSADGAELVAMACRVSEYEVAAGCQRLGEKAFAGAAELAHVTLPEGLESIGPFAFAYTGISSLACPSTLVEIGRKAFLRCPRLREVYLNEGLRSIGSEAFAGSALVGLRVPASVEDIGRSVTVRTGVRHSGAAATFSVDAGNAVFFIDGQGCLYARRIDGVHLMEMLDPDVTSYDVRAGTVAVDEKAFSYHAAIESVVLPEGLKRIGDGAFRVCRKLREVKLPSSVVSVGADAFIDTALERIAIPDGLCDIGLRAFVTDGAHHEGRPPSLREIVVSPGNPRFFMHAGMLCRRTSTGANVVVFTNSCAQVAFPEMVEAVEDYAFNNAFGIEELRLNARLNSIGACGLSVECAIRTVSIEVAEPIEGRTSFLLRFPETSRSVHGFLLALGAFGSLYLPDIMAQYDSCIAGSRDYHAPGDSGNASAYEQVKLICGRLQDSVLLTESNRKRYCTLIVENIEEICVDIARHDDRATLGMLTDLSLLTADNIGAVIEAVNRLQDASMTGYLLELKRIRFGRSRADYDL